MYGSGVYSEYFRIYINNSLTNMFKVSNFIENCQFAIKAIKSPIDFNAKNIGEPVNSPMAEYVNAITVAGEKLLFTRRIEADQKQDQEDIFVFDIMNNSVRSLPFNKSFTNVNKILCIFL